MGESIDPVAAAVALLSVLIGHKLAMYVGPYAVIAAAGLTGATFALSRRDPDAKMGPLVFLVVMVAFSMLLTVGATHALGLLWAPLESTWTLAPMALVIGYIGDDWPRVLRWAAARFGRVLERRSGVE